MKELLKPQNEENIFLVCETEKGEMAFSVWGRYSEQDPAIAEIVKGLGVEVIKYYFEVE